MAIGVDERYHGGSSDEASEIKAADERRMQLEREKRRREVEAQAGGRATSVATNPELAWLLGNADPVETRRPDFKN